MALPVLLVVHQRHSNTGRIGRVLRALGHPTDVRRPSLGDPLPATMTGHAGTVVFGGPMSANDPEPYLRAEMDWLARAMDSGKPVLGVCLGAQLLTKVLGGTVAEDPQGRCEVGWHPVRPADGTDFLPGPLHVYQWHGEGMTLPRDAELLAEGDAFPVQAWRWRNGTGLQFHPEVTGAIMRRWISRALHRWEGRPGAQAAETHLELARRHTPALVSWTRDFLGRWIGGRAEGSERPAAAPPTGTVPGRSPA